MVLQRELKTIESKKLGKLKWYRIMSTIYDMKLTDIIRNKKKECLRDKINGLARNSKNKNI
jgi:hypothetical protein